MTRTPTAHDIGPRIVVYGPSGSGKTLLSRRLGALLGLPVIELDSLFHQAGWQPTADDEFVAKVRAAIGEPLAPSSHSERSLSSHSERSEESRPARPPHSERSEESSKPARQAGAGGPDHSPPAQGDASGWIVDGNYGLIRRELLPLADTVVRLRPAFLPTYWRLVKRTLGRMSTGEELWNGNRESFRLTFLSRDSILLWGISHWRAHRRNVERALAEIPHHARVIELRSSREVEAFLAVVEASRAA